MILSATMRFRNTAGAARRAFTLIELMIVISIMAVVMSLSIPAFYRSLEKDTIRKATQQILDWSADARAQAIISGRPCNLVIHPFDRTFTRELAPNALQTDEERMLEQAQEEIKARTQAPDATGRAAADTLPADISIMFVGVNFVAELQNLEAVPVRFYPNGTADEFTMLITSDGGAVRKFTMDVATGVLKWEVVREAVR